MSKEVKSTEIITVEQQANGVVDELQRAIDVFQRPEVQQKINTIVAGVSRFIDSLGAKGEPAGIEAVEETVITKPFDPDLISIRTEILPMEKFIRLIRLNKINLAPDFQRNEVWTDVQKSQLMESLILSIPLPMFYVSADAKENWTVVDGLQRFSTIRDFILGSDKSYYSQAAFPYKGDGFKLSHMEFFEQYNGKLFKELPEEIQSRILNSEFNVTVIQNGTPEEVKFNIFKRINTGGLPLTPQEIRHALYQGQATSLLSSLAQTDEFKTATNVAVSAGRMADRELVLRMLSFLMREAEGFTATHQMDDFLNETMNKLNSETIQNIEAIRVKFLISMKRAYSIFGDRAFRKSVLGGARTPINKAMFDSIGTAFANLTEEKFKLLFKHKAQFKNILSGAVNNELSDDFGRDGSKYFGVNNRFNFISELLDYCLYGKLSNFEEIIKKYDIGEK